MNQKLTDEVISAYLDGELSPAQHTDVERRIQSSPRAQAQLEDFRKLSRLIQETPQERLPQEFSDQIMHLAERRSLLNDRSPEPVAVFRSWLRPALGVAAAAAVVLVVTFTIPAPAPEEKGVVAKNDAGPSAKMENEEPAAPGLATTAAEQAPAEFGSTTNSLGATASASRKEVLAKKSASPEVAVERKILLPPNITWTPERLGEIIDGIEVDASGAQVAVVKLVVSDLQKWVGGVEVILQESLAKEISKDSQAIAIHVSATRGELNGLLARLHAEGATIQKIGPAKPMQLAALSDADRRFFTPAGTPSSSKSGKPVGVFASPKNKQRLQPKISPANSQAEDKTLNTKTESDNEGVTTANKKETSKSLTEPTATPEGRASHIDKMHVTKASERLLSIAAESEEKRTSAPKSPTDKQQKKRRNRSAKHNDEALVRIIFLVQQSTGKSDRSVPIPKKASGGGGAA